MVDENILVTVKKGIDITELDLSKYHIVFPEKGFIIAFEGLIIDRNKYKYEYKLEGDKKTRDGYSYEPRFGPIGADSNKNSWYYYKGTWGNVELLKRNGEKNYYNLATELGLSN